MTAPREELPSRRMTHRVETEWLDRPCLIDIGFDPEGRAKEAFVTPHPLVGNANIREAHAQARFLSEALRRGMRAAEAAAILSGFAPSLLYAMALAAERLEAEHGGDIRAFHAELDAAYRRAREAIAE